MRILICHNYYQQPGGEDAVFASESSLLREYGHEVVKYTDDNKRINGMSRLAVGAQSIWSRPSQRKLLNILRDLRPDLVHFHNTFLLISPSAYYACQKVGVPVVQTLHNYRVFCPKATFYRDGHVCEDCLGRSLLWPGVLHACYRGSRMQTSVVAIMLTFHRMLKTWQRQVDIYIALTEFAKQKFIEGGIPAKKIFVKPNFVFPDPGMRDGDGDYVVFAGRLSPEKGIITLLRTWQSLKGIPLKIVGYGPLIEEVKVFVQTRKLEDIEILGQCANEEVIALMKGARFLVFPSEWYETFGRVVVEAFACGVPVVASRLGAMEEIVGDKRTGLHFEPGNPEDLAVKVEWAWTHPKEMQNMGYAARAEYEAKYTAERNYKLLMEVYLKVIDLRKQ
ncbi:MAG: glycosyltransferase [Candidatus Dadabacteria bacterium]|nr:glycosyltransferase [Candidatus Dadabacteria bacterium]